MSRRERLERKLEKREEWAASRRRQADSSFTQAHNLVKDIPLGQPILVGHHSEGRHRRVLEKSDNAMRKASEHSDMAAHHASKAGGLEHQLDTSIFSDDPDAVEALTARIAELEAKRERKKRINVAYRKGDEAFAAAMECTVEQAAASRAKIVEAHSWCRQPYPAYELQNLGGNITRLRKCLADVQARATRTARAEAAPGGVVIEGTGDYVRVTFAEKPDRAILTALKDAGFGWGSGSWGGRRDKLPACVLALTEVADGAAT